MKLSIIIPCYNESENIKKLHDELLPVVRGLVPGRSRPGVSEFNFAEIIFVDDGSKDETYEKLEETFGYVNASDMECRFLRHESNRGLGAAIRTGFANSTGDVILTADSDGTYKFSEIPALLSYLKPGVDIVTASPYHPQGEVEGVPAGRLVLSRGSSFLYRCLVDWNIYTYTCLFRAYRGEVVSAVNFSSDGFLAGTEILVGAIMKGYRVSEFPAVLSKRMYGVSKAKIAQTIFAHLNFQSRLLIHRLQMLVFPKNKPLTRGGI